MFFSANLLFSSAPFASGSFATFAYSSIFSLRFFSRHGTPKQPFYLTGQVGGKPFSVHAEGERVIMTGADGRQEIDLVPPEAKASIGEKEMPAPVCPAGVVSSAFTDGHEEPAAPGVSPVDDLVSRREGGST